MNIDNKYIYFLDCTRLENSTNLVSRNNFNDINSVPKQIEQLSAYFKNIGIKEIILSDDVVFSGSVLRSIINIFNQYGISVVGICSAISTFSSFSYFNKVLPLGLTCEFLLDEKVIDQICERDFYFGIAQSGISKFDTNNEICKSPYFIPFGNPVVRASIPDNEKVSFSRNCLLRSLVLWQSIEKLSQRTILIKDLPEKIINTNDTDSVIKVLKKELRKL